MLDLAHVLVVIEAFFFLFGQAGVLLDHVLELSSRGRLVRRVLLPELGEVQRLFLGSHRPGL